MCAHGGIENKGGQSIKAATGEARTNGEDEVEDDLDSYSKYSSIVVHHSWP